LENYQIIRKELVNYGAQIENKKEIIALNKIEIMEKEEVAKIQQEFEKKLDQKVLLISAATGYQLDQLTNLCLEYLQDE
jgi:GTP-binding protein